MLPAALRALLPLIGQSSRRFILGRLTSVGRSFGAGGRDGLLGRIARSSSSSPPLSTSIDCDARPPWDSTSTTSHHGLPADCRAGDGPQDREKRTTAPGHSFRRAHHPHRQAYPPDHRRPVRCSLFFSGTSLTKPPSQLLPRWAHRYRLRRHRPARPLHRQPARFDRPPRGNFTPRLTRDTAARQGCTVIVPYREEMAKRHLKVTGDLGRVVFIVRDPK